MEWDEARLETCLSLEELFVATRDIMQNLTAKGLEIHHVAGAISADGDEYILRNIAELRRQRERVARELGRTAVVISSPSIFTEVTYSSLKVFDIPRESREQMFRGFWRQVIGTGLIKRVHFTPGWERSPGSRDEHDAAKNYGIEVNYLLPLEQYETDY